MSGFGAQKSGAQMSALLARKCLERKCLGRKCLVSLQTYLKFYPLNVFYFGEKRILIL